MGLPISPLDVRYNGFTFPTATETINVAIKPVSDSAGRSVKFVEYTITLKSTLGEANQALGQTTDSDMESVRRKLTSYGGNLVYNNVGLGVNLDINPSGSTGVRDVNWGPKPQLLQWKPMGQQSCDILWAVSFCIPECTTAQYRLAPMEYCFSVDFRRDRQGYTTRVYKGHVAVPQSRLGSQSIRTLSDNADRLLESVIIPLVPGFRRTPMTTALSEDKCRLDFECHDEEVPANFPPPGVVEAQASHSVSTNLRGLSGKYVGTLSATYEVAKDQDPRIAVGHFFQLAKKRMQLTAATPYVSGVPGEAPKVNCVLPVSFTAEEPEIYGRPKARFTLVYTFLSRLADLVLASGLWTRVPNNGWTDWSASLSDTAFHPRGNVKMRFQNSDDVIVDLCATSNAAMGPGTNAAAAIEQNPFYELSRQLNPDNSWLGYETKTQVIQRDYSLSLKRLPQSRLDLQTVPDYILNTPPLPLHVPPAIQGEPGTRADDGLGLNARNVGTIAAYPAGQEPDSVTQVKAQPDTEIVLVGGAIRAGYYITPPAIVRVGQRSVVPRNRPEEGDGFEMSLYGSCFGIPCYRAVWQLRYRMVGTPDEFIPVVHSPNFGA